MQLQYFFKVLLIRNPDFFDYYKYFTAQENAHEKEIG